MGAHSAAVDVAAVHAVAVRSSVRTAAAATAAASTAHRLMLSSSKLLHEQHAHNIEQCILGDWERLCGMGMEQQQQRRRQQQQQQRHAQGEGMAMVRGIGMRTNWLR